MSDCSRLRTHSWNRQLPCENFTVLWWKLQQVINMISKYFHKSICHSNRRPVTWGRLIHIDIRQYTCRTWEGLRTRKNFTNLRKSSREVVAPGTKKSRGNVRKDITRLAFFLIKDIRGCLRRALEAYAITKVAGILGVGKVAGDSAIPAEHSRKWYFVLLFLLFTVWDPELGLTSCGQYYLDGKLTFGGGQRLRVK